jgi:hypothetical protein
MTASHALDREARVLTKEEGLAIPMTSRALPAAAFALALLIGPSRLLAQSADVDAVKRVIRAETETYYQRDAEGWKATWVNDSSAIRTFITSSSYSVALGWNNFGPSTIASIKQSAPEAVRIDRSNYVVRIEGALAWAEYDEQTNYPTGAPPLVARQQRTLVKQNGEWKILSAGSFVGSSYGTDPRSVEDRLTQLGRDLSAAKNYRNALDVLKLSAQLAPSSSCAKPRSRRRPPASSSYGCAPRDSTAANSSPGTAW